MDTDNILEPGIHYNIPFEKYLKLRGVDGKPLVNAGAIKAGVEESMLQMRGHVTGEVEGSDTPDRKFGRAEHCYILEGPEKFHERIKIKTSCCGIKKNGDSCENGGKFVDSKGNWYCGVHADEYCTEDTDAISQEEFGRIVKSLDALRNHKCFKVLRVGGLPEVTWVAPIFGVMCKGRIDFFREADSMIIDLKKFDAKPLTRWNVNKVIADLDYHIQAELYRMGIEKLTGDKPTFIWLFARSKAMQDVIPAQLSERDAASARAWIELILTDYRECEVRGEWTGAHPDAKPMMSNLPDHKIQQTPHLEGAQYDHYEPASGQQELTYEDGSEAYPY